jgi:hypothetical protein
VRISWLTFARNRPFAAFAHPPALGLRNPFGQHADIEGQDDHGDKETAADRKVVRPER